MEYLKNHPGAFTFYCFYKCFLVIRCTNICNHADSTTILHAIQLEIIARQIETDRTLVAKWLSDNYLKLNDDQCNLMTFGDR